MKEEKLVCNNSEK